MYDEWYSPLFKTANELYGMDIYAYYFDIPFEETVRRHNTRDKKQEFGEEDMRRWWREKMCIRDRPSTAYTEEGCNLYFKVEQNGTAVDPLLLLD